MIKKFRPIFCFLSKTKSTVLRLSSLFDKCSPTFCTGVDAVGSSGSLFLLAWSRFDVVVLFSSPNVIFCHWVDSDGVEFYIMFVYGAPRVEDRAAVWDLLRDLFIPLTRCLIIGEFNQVELSEDKFGGSTVIRGWEEFMNWRVSSNLLDVPFSGPTFTWSNKHKDQSLVIERLDRAYMSSEWFLDYPDCRVIH